jgi:hypothetical protein
VLRRSTFLVLAMSAASIWASVDSARALTVVTDEGVFLRALNGGATTYAFDEFVHLQSVTSQLPGVTFTNAMIYDEQHHPSGGAFRTPPNVLMNADWYAAGPIVFAFDPPVRGVGFFNTSIVDGERVTLFGALGDTLFSGELPDSCVTFLGVLSDALIHSGTIGSRPPSNGTIFIDNFSFGQVERSTFFTDQSAFLQALGSSALTCTFDEFTHLQPLTSQLPGVAFSNATVYDEEHFPSNGSFQTPPNVLMNADWYAAGPIAFSFDPPVRGVGFFNTSIVDRERLVLFGALGDTLFAGDVPGGSVNFLGFVSDAPICSGTVRSRPPTNGTIFIDDFSFGPLGPAVVPASPRSVALLEVSCLPNPVRSEALIRYSVPCRGVVRLEILDVMGRTVRLLSEMEAEPGTRSVKWDGRGAGGRHADSGIYFVRLMTAHGHRSSAVIVLE